MHLNSPAVPLNNVFISKSYLVSQICFVSISQVSLMAQLVKNLSAMWETWLQSLGWEDPMENGMATYSSIPTWRIPWTVQSMWVAKSWTRLSYFHYFSDIKNPPANTGDTDSIPESGQSLGVGNGNPLQYSCLGNSMDRRDWCTIVHGVAKSWT